MARSEKSSTSEAKRDITNDVHQNTDVGISVEKVDGRGLVTGKASFTDDIETSNALAAKVLRSPHAHARIINIDTDEAERIDGVRTVLTHEDVPDVRYTRAGFPYPQKAPFDELVLDTKVRFVGDAVALVAAETEAAAEKAVECIEVQYDVLDPVIDLKDATDPDSPSIHDETEYENLQEGADLHRNIVCEMEHSRGDVVEGFAEADHVIEDEYEIPVVQQAQMEMNTSIAWVDGRDRLVLRTGSQIPHQVRDQISRVFGIPRRDVQIIKPKVGGGFGVKQDVVPSQYFAAALALATGEMVRIENKRKEDLHVAQTRHAASISVKVGVKNDGSITAIQMENTINAGAYGCHTPTVLSVSGHTPIAIYSPENIRLTGRGVYTNITPGGAMRGYGAVQGGFALESHIDTVAETIGMDPLEFRRLNALTESDELFEADYGVPKMGTLDNIGIRECIRNATKAINWGANREMCDDGVRYGYGMSIGLMKSGVPGHEFAAADIELENDGTFTLRVGVGDAGQGAETTVAQIAASVLGVETARIHVKADDTDATPWDNGAYADSTTYVSGQAAERAAADVAEQIRNVSSRWLDGKSEDFDLVGGDVIAPDGDRLSIRDVADRTFRGEGGQRVRLVGHGECNPTISPRPFVAHAAEICVDEQSGEFDILNYTVAADCGYAINPENAKGQLFGGVTMGLGQALTEELPFDDDGVPQISGLKDYQTLRSVDIPDTFNAILVETYEPTGPFGAKSIGEVGITGPTAAVANAVADAVDIRLTELPITQKKVRDQIESK